MADAVIVQAIAMAFGAGLVSGLVALALMGGSLTFKVRTRPNYPRWDIRLGHFVGGWEFVIDTPPVRLVIQGEAA